MPYIGSRVKRKEDVRLLRGIGKYVGDIHRAGMVHAAILRSTHAHARIVKIDAVAALKLPGVVGVLTAADMPGLKTIPMRTGVIPGFPRFRLNRRRGILDPASFRSSAGESRPGSGVGRGTRASDYVGSDQDDPYQLAHSFRAHRTAAELDPFHRTGSRGRLRRARRI